MASFLMPRPPGLLTCQVGGENSMIVFLGLMRAKGCFIIVSTLAATNVATLSITTDIAS
jgi:hypothetical protein